VLLLNNDIEVVTPGWLTEMVGLAVQSGVGAVGARLWYPDWTLQHGGVFLSPVFVAGHAHKRLPRGMRGYAHRAALVQNVSAVTGACLLVSKANYERFGGLDEYAFKVAYNDVDFCLRLTAAGLRNVWTPYAELIHHESATRGHEHGDPSRQARFEAEQATMRERWSSWLEHDPAYSPNLTAVRENFGYAWPPRLPPR
jgi:GT2 family glycosyltransferase